VEDDWRDVGKSVGSVNDLREASTLAALRVDRATVVARGRQIETEAAPIRYVAELLGADTDSERAIRWLTRVNFDDGAVLRPAGDCAHGRGKRPPVTKKRRRACECGAGNHLTGCLTR